MADTEKIIPQVTDELRPFFEGARRNRLVVQQCADCGKRRFPPGEICAECLSRRLSWVEVCGRGRVYSYSIMHRAYHPAFAGKVPCALVVVELEEGGKIMSNVVGMDPHQLKCGMPLEVTFEKITEEIVLPKFRPAPISA
jgi:uncharacterized OB-fold protein